MNLLQKYPLEISRYGVLQGIRYYRTAPECDCHVLMSKDRPLAFEDCESGMKRIDHWNAFFRMKSSFLKNFKKDISFMNELGFETIDYGLYKFNDLIIGKTCEVNTPPRHGKVDFFIHGEKESFWTNELYGAMTLFVSSNEVFEFLPSKTRDMLVL